MSLKFNLGAISKVKLNGNEITEIKLNNNVYYKKDNTKLTYINNVIKFLGSDGTYELYYANENGKLADYEKIDDIVVSNGVGMYNYFNALNKAPEEATKIILTLNNNVITSMTLPTNLEINGLGTKLYTVGVLSDVHIDGNGDGNNKDSGNSQSDFQNALTFYNNKNVDFITICGDVTYYGYDLDYEVYNTLINTYSPSTPVKALRGNHECYANGSNNYDSSNTKFQDNVAPLFYEYTFQNDKYLFVGMRSENSSDPYTTEELNWLAEKLETYRNQRVFLFTHYYVAPVGNVNGVSTHSSISNATFLNLVKRYRNVIYFSGHTHLAFYLQKYGFNANIKARGDNMCHRVHIPSCATPRVSEDGLVGTAVKYADGSEGYLMDVYSNAIVLKGINFQTNKYKPIATYVLDTAPIEIEELKIIKPKMKLGTLSRSDGTESESTKYIITADYIDISGATSLILNNNTADGSNNMCLFYDTDKNFLTAWNGSYNYQYIINGGTIEIPTNAKYLRVRISTNDTFTVLTITKEV